MTIASSRFVLDALRIFRKDDGFVGSDNRRRWLEEYHRLFGDFVAEFGGVRGVVAADADNFARLDGGDEAHVRNRPSASRQRPFLPGCCGKFGDVIVLNRTEQGSCCPRGRRCAIEREEPAEFHTWWFECDTRCWLAIWVSRVLQITVTIQESVASIIHTTVPNVRRRIAL